MEKENSGTLFHNNKTNDKQPDYTGVVTIEGKKYKASAWVNTASSGNKYISVRYKEDIPYTKPAQETQYQAEPQDHRSYDPDDDFSL